ncbi:MAG: hypothetical protein HKO01_12765 [Flaviramulus sp.]|nr:hypothetical protein [Flaviramulus sp.]NNC51394.1 hypothetical protein [Flaviramulus sp.]
MIDNLSKLKTLAEELSISNLATDILPWYVKKDKDSISQKLNSFRLDLQRSKDSVEYYLQPSFTEGGTHAIRFVYNDDTPHSSIFVEFAEKDTIANIIHIDDWRLTQKVVKENKSQSKGVWDIPPPPLPPIIKN